MRRIPYVPGLLSSVLLLPLCLWYLHKQRAFREERCFNLAFLPEERTDIDSVLGFDEWRVRHAKYAAVPPEFQVAGGLGEASGPLLGFRQRMMDLANARDTNTWVHVRFASDVTYATVMHAVETCRSAAYEFSLYRYDLVARFYWRPSHPPRSADPSVVVLNECLLCDDVIEIPPTRREKAAGYIASFIAYVRPVWPAVPIFLVLAIIGLVRGVKAVRSYSL